MDSGDYQRYAKRAKEQACAAYEYAKPYLKLSWGCFLAGSKCARKGARWLADRTTTDRILATSTVVIMFATIGGAVSTYLQWQELRSSSVQVDQSIAATNRIANAGIEANQLNKAAFIASARAWVGPNDAHIVPPVDKAPLKGTIMYGNTGREPAPTFATLIPKVYPIADWNGGAAVTDIENSKNECLKLPMNDLLARITFPTTGFNTFNESYDGTPLNIRDVNKIAITDKIVSGSEIVAFKGCFVYRTVSEVHRTAFCYYYQAKVSDAAHLNFCNVGQAAN